MHVSIWASSLDLIQHGPALLFFTRCLDPRANWPFGTKNTGTGKKTQEWGECVVVKQRKGKTREITRRDVWNVGIHNTEKT